MDYKKLIHSAIFVSGTFLSAAPISASAAGLYIGNPNSCDYNCDVHNLNNAIPQQVKKAAISAISPKIVQIYNSRPSADLFAKPDSDLIYNALSQQQNTVKAIKDITRYTLPMGKTLAILNDKNSYFYTGIKKYAAQNNRNIKDFDIDARKAEIQTALDRGMPRDIPFAAVKDIDNAIAETSASMGDPKKLLAALDVMLKKIETASKASYAKRADMHRYMQYYLAQFPTMKAVIKKSRNPAPRLLGNDEAMLEKWANSPQVTTSNQLDNYVIDNYSLSPEMPECRTQSCAGINYKQYIEGVGRRRGYDGGVQVLITEKYNGRSIPNLLASRQTLDFGSSTKIDEVNQVIFAPSYNKRVIISIDESRNLNIQATGNVRDPQIKMRTRLVFQENGYGLSVSTGGMKVTFNNQKLDVKALGDRSNPTQNIRH